MAIIITISGKEFSFEDNSNVEAEGYDLKITEVGFDEKTSEFEDGFTSEPMILPNEIEYLVKRTSLEPCSRIHKDASGKRKLTAYFD